MPANNDDIRRPKSESKARFEHISIGQTTQNQEAFVEEEEFFEIDSEGVHTPAQSEPEQSKDQSEDTNTQHSFSRRHHDADSSEQEKHYRAEDEDYGLEGLEPMPLAQKIVLFLVILIIIAGVFWILKYYMGF